MIFKNKQIEITSDGNFNVVNITDKVRAFITETGVKNGHFFAFYQHTTGAIIIGEFEAGIVADLRDTLERIAPAGLQYKHHIRAVDFNGHAHVRAALMPTEVGAPIVDGKLGVGAYQDFIIVDDQVDFEPRYVMLQVIGE
jgi:secondary thiamine-phosphate synthase enzyme